MKNALICYVVVCCCSISYSQDTNTSEKSNDSSPQVSPEQLAAAEKLALPVAVTNSIGMKLVLIPAGEFTMGMPEEDQQDLDRKLKNARSESDYSSAMMIGWGIISNGQRRRARLTKPFYLSIHEVTQDQYDQVMGVDSSKFEPSYPGIEHMAKKSRDEMQLLAPRMNGPRHPVTRVSWNDAIEFCHKISGLPDEMAAARTYCLPTETQWEYACRAGTATRYYFGDDASKLGQYAWFWENSEGVVHPVGQKLPNAWGLYDMLGNASEWCEDKYFGYDGSPVVDPTGSPARLTDRITERATRGFIDSAHRNGAQPGNRYYHLGFRVALKVPTVSDSPATGNAPGENK